MTPIDLGALDAKVARASAALTRDLASLAGHASLAAPDRDDAWLLARRTEPLDGLREVAGKSTYDALAAFEPNLVEASHRAALQRWVHELLQARVGWDLVIDEAERASAIDEAVGTSDPQPIATTWNEAHRALFAGGRIDVALARLAELADPILAVRRERSARRLEASRRLGLAHPWDLVADGGARGLAVLARGVLDATEPLALDLHKRASPWADLFALDAREGWPARLTPRWLEDAFRTIVPRAPKHVKLPAAIGGASFLRAAAAWGHAVRSANTARSLPFALARDPAPTEAYVFGDTLAVVVAGAVFARRKLGLAAAQAAAHTRVLARPLFFTLRNLAAILCLGIEDGEEAEHLGARVFGAPLPRALGAVWAHGGISGAARVDAPARLLGAVRAHAWTTELVDRFDEDWFDNPRAGARLAAVAAGPIWQGDAPPEGLAMRIARAFEEALG